jgi:DNA-binding protein YbaB
VARTFAGTALAGAVEVVVDERGSVLSVRLNEKMVGRLWADQLGDAVVAAHAEARVDASKGG